MQTEDFAGHERTFSHILLQNAYRVDRCQMLSGSFPSHTFFRLLFLLMIKHSVEPEQTSPVSHRPPLWACRSLTGQVKSFQEFFFSMKFSLVSPSSFLFSFTIVQSASLLSVGRDCSLVSWPLRPKINT